MAKNAKNGMTVIETAETFVAAPVMNVIETEKTFVVMSKKQMLLVSEIQEMQRLFFPVIGLDKNAPKQEWYKYKGQIDGKRIITFKGKRLKRLFIKRKWNVKVKQYPQGTRFNFNKTKALTLAFSIIRFSEENQDTKFWSAIAKKLNVPNVVRN